MVAGALVSCIHLRVLWIGIIMAVTLETLANGVVGMKNRMGQHVSLLDTNMKELVNRIVKGKKIIEHNDKSMKFVIGQIDQCT